jgi:hypothetical protein
LENHPDQIRKVLQMNLDVEIDVWYENQAWWLGHDAPQYKISGSFLDLPGLWIHAKNFPAASMLLQGTRMGHEYNFFWHESDARTLTSLGYWWTYPGQEVDETSVAVMPEMIMNLNQITQVLNWRCYGVCTDWCGSLT